MENKSLYEQSGGNLSYNGHAGFGIRFVAHLIDGLILSLGLGIITFATGMNFNSDIMEIVYSPGSLLAFLLTMAYFVYFETSDKQATIGKSVMGLKVIKQDGTKLTTGDAVVRYLGKILSAFIFMIGFIMVIFDDQKRALHDRIANTFVVKT